MQRGSVTALCACLALLGPALAACGSHGDRGSSPTALLKSKRFVSRVDNSWFPLTPGTAFVYRGVQDGEPGRDIVTVTGLSKVIQGVRCTVVYDRVYLRGRLFERTSDWYAQDDRGNVWYLGESTAELDRNGRVKSTEGSWEAGVDGAVAGILMPAHPKVGQAFRQEFYKGEAEDHSQVLSVSARVRVPFTSSNTGLLTKEWTPLEPGVVDHKLYVRGIGEVKEETIRGGDERFVLVDVQR